MGRTDGRLSPSASLLRAPYGANKVVLPVLTPAVTGNWRHCTLLTQAVQKCDGYTTVILIGAQRLSCGSQRLSCGAHGYPAVHNGYPRRTWVGAETLACLEIRLHKTHTRSAFYNFCLTKFSFLFHKVQFFLHNNGFPKSLILNLFPF